MKRSLLALIALALLSLPSSAADRFHVKDKGGFAPTGRFIEFPSRYGWKSYEVDYDFGIDTAKHRLTRRSTLRITIHRKDGTTWKHKCRAKNTREMWANISQHYNKSITVLTECRIDPKKFARSINVDYDLVGEPTLVFQVMINSDDAQTGAHKGMYFVASGEIEASAMAQYATKTGDPSQLGVLFSSKQWEGMPLMISYGQMAD